MFFHIWSESPFCFKKYLAILRIKNYENCSIIYILQYVNLIFMSKKRHII